MLNILIADDEYLVAAGLSTCVDWESLGFAPPLTASSGQEALELLKQVPVDILITDIAMEPIGGIELMKRVREKGYDLEIIVLSCYNDFAYSRQALQSGACDFLFKPAMMPDEITQAVRSARDKLLERRGRLEKLTDLESRERQNRGEDTRRFLLEIIDGKPVSRESVRSRCRELSFPLPLSGLGLVVVRAGAPGEHSEFQDAEYLLRYGIGNALEETAAGHRALYLPRSLSEHLFLLEGAEDWERIIPEVRRILLEVFSLPSVCGVSDMDAALWNLRVAYEQAYTMAERQLVMGLEEPGYFGSAPVPARKGDVVHRSLKILYRGDGRPYSEKVSEIFQELRREEAVSLSHLREISANMIMGIMQDAMLNREGLSYLYDKQSSIFSGLSALESIGEFERYVRGVSDDVEDYLKDNCRGEIYEARRYMAEHLADPELNVETVADHVHLSKNYFSTLFRRDTGGTFTAFLTELRMKRAAELQRTGTLKVYQIAEAVGYTDWRYFTKVFKKYFGKTITEL